MLSQETTKFNVTLFEQNDKLGGHSNTVQVETPIAKIPVDTGFIVFNLLTYPNLVKFFDYLGKIKLD
jgi:uncharacterized protein